jgi:uncharacterized membrane protein YfcA
MTQCNMELGESRVHDLIFGYSPIALFALVAAGILIGMLSGLLGVGGGIVAVPVLVEVFEQIEVADGMVMPLAVGTAHANILFASVSAVGAHWRNKTIDTALVKAWLPALMVGTACGLALGPIAPAKVLTTIFAALAVLLGVKMLLGDRMVLARQLPKGPSAHLPSFFVGALASALGVGGGTLSTPILSFFSFPIRRAIGAGALFNLVIALPATITFLAQGWSVAGKPADAVGEIALFCVAALSLPALFVAPAAARWSARMPLVLLRRLFALCLVAIALRLLFRL